MYRPEFQAYGIRSDQVCLENAVSNLMLEFPVVSIAPVVNEKPLAIVGGGPSAREHLDELRAWPGDIWAINHTANWLLREGVADEKLWFFTVDPDARMLECLGNYTKALIGTSCDPAFVAGLKGKDVRLVHVVAAGDAVEAHQEEEGGEPLCGPSSVCRTFLPAMQLRYTKGVTYFGCEGSFLTSTHAYEYEDKPLQMIVRAGGKDYRTTPDYYLTTLFLSRVIRRYPKFSERSGGLLRALIEHPENWTVVAYSTELAKIMDPTAIEQEIPYRAA